MNYQPTFRAGFDLPALPPVRDRVRFMMQAVALIVDGPVDAPPERYGERLQNCILMPKASLLICGTPCRRPLLLREAGDIAASAGLDAVVVRLAEPGSATFDVYVADRQEWLCAYRLWMPRPSAAGWLVPMAGEDNYVRLTSCGLEHQKRVPFAEPSERSVGLLRGHEFMSVAATGWF